MQPFLFPLILICPRREKCSARNLGTRGLLTQKVTCVVSPCLSFIYDDLVKSKHNENASLTQPIEKTEFTEKTEKQDVTLPMEAMLNTEMLHAMQQKDSNDKTEKNENAE